MKSIKEAEMITGISSQNIRYYEKQRLLSPSRNAENSYREYSQEDINRLKLIKLFRKLDVPIGDIRRLIDGETTLEETMLLQVYRLQSEKERLDEAITFCSKIQEQQLAELDVDQYLHQMEEREKKGSVFKQFINDYKEVVKSEMAREFSFMPEVRCDTPEEFSESLLKYGQENNRNMVILKESMSPRLLIDGVEYYAYRTSSRYGIVIHCEMLYPQDYIPAGMSEKKYRRYRFFSLLALPVLFFLICNFWVVRDLFATATPLESLLGLFIVIILFAADLCFLYYCYGKNFKG